MKANDTFLRPRLSPEVTESAIELALTGSPVGRAHTLYCYAETRKGRDRLLNAHLVGVQRRGQRVVGSGRSCLLVKRRLIYYGWIMVEE